MPAINHLIGCRRRGNDLEIQVHDTGPGLSKDERRVIFTEFKRLAPKAKRADQIEGVGLGLAIVERAARLLGHPLDLRSAPDHGSVFSVSVPLSGPIETEVQRRDENRTDWAESRIVLVLSANEALSDQIIATLDRWGMAGINAATVDEAERSIAQLGMSPDAVLVDQASFPLEALSRIANLDSAMARKVILTDGSANQGQAEVIAGAVYLSQPMRPHRLRAALN